MVDFSRCVDEFMWWHPDLVDEAIRMLGAHSQRASNGFYPWHDVVLLIARGVEFRFYDDDTLRRSDLRRELDDCIEASTVLVKRIEALGWRLTSLGPTFRAAQAQHLDHPVLDDVYKAGAVSLTNRSLLVDGLRALETSLAALKRLIPTDKGGRGSAQRSLHGNWKALLAVEAGLVFFDYRPHKLSGVEGGPFYQFFGCLYEIISGDEPEDEGVGLKKYVAHVAPLVKSLVPLRRHESMLKRLADRKNDPEGTRLACEVYQEYMAIESTDFDECLRADLEETQWLIRELEQRLRLGPR